MKADAWTEAEVKAGLNRMAEGYAKKGIEVFTAGKPVEVVSCTEPNG